MSKKKPVSHAGRFIAAIQSSLALSDYAMSARLCINHQILNRLKHEPSAGLSNETLINIMEHLEDDNERARFLACYLRDRLVGPDAVRNRITIVVDGPPPVDDCISINAQVVEAAKRLVSSAIDDERVRGLILSLSKLIPSF